MANYAPSAKVEEARQLRSLGYSTRLIAKKTGLHRETVLAYTGRIGRSDSMKAHHARRKGVVSPKVNIVEGEVRRRKRRFKPIGEEASIEVVAIECVPSAPAPLPTVANYRFDGRTKLTAEEEAELWQAWKTDGDVSARDLIIRCHLQYVKTIAKMMSKKFELHDTLIAEGNFGLLHAVDKFEPERGLRFITYASYWIKSAISNYLHTSNTIINKQLVRSNLIYGVRKMRTRARNILGESDEAITLFVSERLNLPVEKVQDLLQRLDCQDVSIDAKIFPDSHESMVDYLVADTPLPDAAYHASKRLQPQQEAVASALEILQPREKFIMEKRLMDDDPLPLAELGRQLGVSRERARQLEARAIRKLKQALRPFVVSMQEAE